MTTEAAAGLIVDAGLIDPAFSQGKKRCTFYVNQSMITWAIAHVAVRHSVKVCQLWVFSVPTVLVDFMRTNRHGVYVCFVGVKPTGLMGADRWLANQEARIGLGKQRSE